MKSILTLISIGFLVSILRVHAELPNITMCTTETIGNNFSLVVSTSSNNSTIQIDWGNGIPVPYKVGLTDTTLSHILAGNTIKIFGSGINKLDVKVKKLISLDVSGASGLSSLICSGNALATLDVSNNTALNYLNCNRNALTALDVTKNSELNYLECGENALTGLDVTRNKQLISLYCAWNSILNLKVLYNPKLKYLDCGSNRIHNLDLSKNKNLQSLNCYWNVIGSLDLSNNTNLTEIHCSKNKLKTLILPNDSSLTIVHCNSNLLQTLDLTGCPSLISLQDSSNLLTSLDVSNCKNLEELFCNNNQLTTLDISNCLVLKYLNLNGNNFTFETLPPITSNLLSYLYGKQILIKIGRKDFKVGDKVDLSLFATNNGVPSNYIWKTENGDVLPEFDYSEINKVFTLLKTHSDSIYCQISNTNFPDLILETEKISVSSPTSIRDLNQNMAIFPNPCHNNLNIKLSTSIDKVEIYSISGIRIYETKVNASSVNINVSGFPKGALFLKVYSNGKYCVNKVVVK